MNPIAAYNCVLLKTPSSLVLRSKPALAAHEPQRLISDIWYFLQHFLLCRTFSYKTRANTSFLHSL